MFNVKGWLLIILLLTAGCSTTQQPAVELASEPVVYYAMPSPVPPPFIEWKVLTEKTIDSDVYIGLTYNESLILRQWLEDLRTYIEKQKVIICKYQEC